MSSSTDAVDQEDFEHLVRDALANLFDLAALQTHPLAAYPGQGPNASRPRGELLREALEQAIEQLRPGEDPPREGAPEWRPYLVLRWRYVDGVRLQDIQERLALSERQLRREHGRALQAVTAMLWERFFLGQGEISFQPGGEGMNDQANAFPITLGPLNLSELLKSVADTLQNRFQHEAVSLTLQTSIDETPPIISDRVILRQVLIRLINSALDTSSSGEVAISCADQAGTILVTIAYPEENQPIQRPFQDRALEEARYWAQKTGASVDRLVDPQREGLASLVISLPRSDQPVLLVVDDQETAHRMYRRYMSQKNVRIVGLTDGSQVVETARTLQPDAIILDVMIPNIDGWEALQTLRANPQTRHIPVIISTVWEEPELAYSMGAAEFLKKPFSQQDFLAALARLGLA